MKLKIEITMDNAAFEDSNGSECARILGELIAEIHDRNYTEAETIARLRDLNGNAVGTAKITR